MLDSLSPPAVMPDWSRLKGLLDPVPVGVVLFDQSGNPLLANRAARDLLGEGAAQSIDDWIGSGRFLLPTGEAATAEDLPPAQTLADGTAHVERELLYRRWTERSLPLLVSSRSVLDPEGHVTQVACSLTPITELCRRREEDRRQQRAAALGALTNGVAGPLNDALTAIGGYCDLAAARLGGEEPLGRLVAAIRDAGERASLLVQGFFSRAQCEVAAPRTLELDAWIAAQAPRFHALLGGAHELDVVTNASGCSVRADPGLLHQVLADLIVNAREAMPDGGRVRIETASYAPDGSETTGQDPSSAMAVVAVTDAGGGMSDAVLRRAFEPFFTTKPGALGLGLPTAERLLRTQGAHLRVQNHRGVGTTMQVHLPHATRAQTVRAQADAVVRSDEPARVLLVEDDPVVRDLVRQILEGDGYAVKEARTADEARHHLVKGGSGSVDLVVTDLVMPGTSGAHFAGELRADHPDIAVLVMSGCSDPRLIAAITSSGTAFLPKPFPPAALLHRVRTLLGRRGDARGVPGAGSE